MVKALSFRVGFPRFRCPCVDQPGRGVYYMLVALCGGASCAKGGAPWVYVEDVERYLNWRVVRKGCTSRGGAR